MAMVLLDMLETVSVRLGRLNLTSDVRDFAGMLRRHRPEAFADLDEVDVARAAEGIAEMSLEQIQDIPRLADLLRRQMTQAHAPPALQAGIAFALAYLVCPPDLLHDDLPGGYGFVDDAVMLCALAGAVFRDRPDTQSQFEEAKGAIKLLSMSVPRELAGLLEDAADDAIRTFFALGHVPAELLMELTRQYIEYPAEKIIQAVSHLAVAKNPPQGSAPAGARFFDLPAGSAGFSGAGLIGYRFEDGDFVALD